VALATDLREGQTHYSRRPGQFRRQVRFYSVVKEQYSNSGPLGPNLHYNSNLICCQLLFYGIAAKLTSEVYMLFIVMRYPCHSQWF